MFRYQTNWPCTKRLIQTTNTAFLIFNPCHFCGINYLEYYPNQSVHQTHAEAKRRETTKKVSKSYILSEALNASLGVSRSSTRLLCLCACMCEHCSGTQAGAITNLYRYTGRLQYHIARRPQAKYNACSPCVHDHKVLYNTHTHKHTCRNILHYTANSVSVTHIDTIFNAQAASCISQNAAPVLSTPNAKGPTGLVWCYNLLS